MKPKHRSQYLKKWFDNIIILFKEVFTKSHCDMNLPKVYKLYVGSIAVYFNHVTAWIIVWIAVWIVVWIIAWTTESPKQSNR